MKIVKVKVIEERETEIRVLIPDESDSSEAIEKVERMYKDGEFELKECDITSTVYLEKTE